MADTPEMTPGTFGWNELLTTDAAACKAFYSGLMGWTTEEMPIPGGGGGVYTIFKSGDRPAGGMMQMVGPEFEGVPPNWMGYLTVEDVDASCAKCTALGGAVRMGPFDIEGIGRFAVIADPAGAHVGLATYVAPDG